MESDLDSLQAHALQPVVYELGVAVYLCQQFETSFLFLVAILTANGGIVNAQSFKDGFALHSKKTLGQLLDSFKSKLPLPENYANYIWQGVDVRNRIIHGFVMRNTPKLISVEGRFEIVSELRDAQHEINMRCQSLDELLDRTLQLFGGSLDQLRKEASLRFEPDVFDEIARH
jgi:hypothetical protein